jgi:hypothetical protein
VNFKGFLSILLLSIGVQTAKADYVTNLVLTSVQDTRVSKILVVEANQVAAVTGENISLGTCAGCFEKVERIGGQSVTNLPISTFANWKVTGPAIAEIAIPGGSYPSGYLSVRVSFSVTNVVTSSSSIITPSTAVVIPADAGGPVTVTLESSTDLVNWNATLPGTYGTSTTNRFFRVRAVR